MAQVVVEPEQLKKFAQDLQRFNNDLQNRMSALQAGFAALGETWNDQEQAKFAEEFRDTLKTLKKFTQISQGHVPYLLRKAQRIEEYLKQR